MLHLIIWVVVGLLALSFFGISLRALVENPTSQENFSYLGTMLELGWGYIETSWNEFVSIFSDFGS